MDTFFMVWVMGTGEARKRWEIRADAEAEAERLARTTGKPVYLLESVDMCTVADAPIQWERKEKYGPIPPQD